MNKLDKASLALQTRTLRNEDAVRLDPRVAVGVTLLYLVFMLSVSIGRLSVLIWFAVYPIIASSRLGVSYGKIFKASLTVLPLVILIGIFNPLYDRTIAFTVGDVAISDGWISFVSIVIRGLLAMQSVLILIEIEGFSGMCFGMHRLGMPRFLTDQLQFVYRYISVLLREASTMNKARLARGYGKKNIPLKLWGQMVGQLFLRSIDRSERIHKAMLARGFTGTLPSFSTSKRGMTKADWIFLAAWTIVFTIFRFVNLSEILFSRLG